MYLALVLLFVLLFTVTTGLLILELHIITGIKETITNLEFNITQVQKSLDKYVSRIENASDKVTKAFVDLPFQELFKTEPTIDPMIKPSKNTTTKPSIYAKRNMSNIKRTTTPIASTLTPEDFKSSSKNVTSKDLTGKISVL